MTRPGYRLICWHEAELAWSMVSGPKMSLRAAVAWIREEPEFRARWDVALDESNEAMVWDTPGRSVLMGDARPGGGEG